MASTPRSLTREQCVDHIVGMMQRNEWRRGRSGPPLAREWGVDERTVRGYAAEASNVLRREIQDPEAVKQDVSVVMRVAMDMAMEDGKYRDAVAAGDVLTRILGARSPERHEVTMTPEQAAAKYREITGMDWKPGGSE